MSNMSKIPCDQNSLSSAHNENELFLTTQIITYIGNKRTLIGDIETQIEKIKTQIGKDKCVCADLFSGSGIVARMMKRHSSLLIANDLEKYSIVINSCYLTNKNEFDASRYKKIKSQIDGAFESARFEGVITKNYAPKDETHITKNDRVFYTRENAVRIDTYRKLIDEIVPQKMQNYFLAPLLTEASVHVNTSGVFKGFYKNRKGVGAFGGEGKNALTRICGTVELQPPVFSNFECKTEVYSDDAVKLAEKLKGIDIAYLDPPYNQHPYGSNYFMLNLILQNEITAPVSKVSGIVSGWNRSDFNKKQTALVSMEKIVSALDAKFLIVSYNSEGFISFEEMSQMLEKYGTLQTIEIKYNTFRGSRNLAERNIHVSEYLFVLQKYLH